MPSEAQNLPRLMAVAHALGPLRERVVFVGGAVVNLYSTTSAATPEPRITEDVDCIVEVAPRTAFYQLEDELRALGFVNDVASGVICRWLYQGLTVDVMPTDPTILGFGNPWYAEGFAQAKRYTLPNEMTIQVLSSVYFLGTKLVALRERGWVDLRVSQDLEDIVHVVANRAELPAELAQAPGAVRAYVCQQLYELLAHPAFAEALSWTIPYGADYTYQQTLHQRLRELANGSDTE
ncbi:MAG: nucleotidyl transferase AbiEii/AbiGii toxin family protein [Janthinobacterium lividum]